MASQGHKFLAMIYKIWMMRHVDVPPEIADALIKQLHARKHSTTRTKRKPPKSPKPAKPKYIPVTAIVNGRSSRVTLTPAGGGHYRIQLNTALRKAAHADVGDVVSVELRLDLASRDIAVPAELAAILKEHPKARKEFDRLPSGHRRQLLLYYLRAKSPKAREHVMERFLDHLRERALLRVRSAHDRRT